MPHRERNMVPLYLTDQERLQLDQYADTLNTSRQKILEAIIESSLDDMDTMDKTGLLVSEVRLIDQINMFKKLTLHGINEKASKHIDDEE